MNNGIKQYILDIDSEAILSARTQDDNFLKLASSKNDSLEKVASELAEEIYQEMKSDEDFRDHVICIYKEAKISMPSIKAGFSKHGPMALAGIAAAGSGYAIGKSRSTDKSVTGLAKMLAAETTSDIQTEQIMGREMMRNRSAILSLARALDGQVGIKKKASCTLSSAASVAMAAAKNKKVIKAVK